MPAERVLVLFESGRGGGSALAVGRELALEHAARLTVVCVAPQAASGARCGNSALDFNRAIADDAARDLDLACERLASAGVGATYKLLVEGKDPTLPEFASEREFDLVLLPARRRLLGGHRHPEAARVSRACGVAVRVVRGVAAGS